MKTLGGRHLAFAGLLLLAGGAGGVAVRLRMAGPEAADSGRGVPESLFRKQLSPGAAALWGRLVAALGRASGGFTFEKLERLLARHRSDRAAAAFIEGFRREPELQAYWSEFEHAPDAVDAAALSRKLSDSSRFAELLNRYAEDPGFVQLAEAAVRDLEEGGVAGAPTTVPGSAGAAPASPTPPAAGVVLRTAVAAAGRPSPTAGRLEASDGPAGEGARPAAGAAPAGGGPAETAAGIEDTKEIREHRSGDEAHKVLKLAALKAAGPSVDLAPWASLCYKENPAISREECARINQYLGDDPLWTACHKAGLLDKCVSLCRDKTELGCGAQASALLTCRNRWPAQACAEACGARPDCRIQEPAPDPTPALGAPEGEEQGGNDGSGGPRCPGPNCDQCSSNPSMPGCNDFCAQHPQDCD